MRSISTRPVAAARATKSKTRTVARATRVQIHRERGRCKLATLKAIRELPTTRTATHRASALSVVVISGKAAGVVNTDISEPHALTTKRAGPERAFERDALTVQRATAHSIPLRALTRERRAGTRREPETPRLQPRRPNVRSSGASRRAPLIPVGPPPVQPPARSGAKAALGKGGSSLSDTERPPGVLPGRRAASSPGRPT